MKKFIAPVFLMVWLFSCTEPSSDFPEGEVVGYKPVYASDVDLTISFGPAVDVMNSGKIFRQGDILLLNEVGEGVHFINNADPTAPVNLGFLKIKGSTDMSVKDDVLYVNQYTDIVSLDFSDLQNVREINRQAGAFETGNQGPVPPQRGYFFECIDASKGQVINWVLTTINQPKCYR